MSCELSAQFDFRGGLLPVAEHVTAQIVRLPDYLSVTVEAPSWDDPAPSGPAGSSAELWRYSVFELFILGEGGRYLELELSPFGHYWLLELSAWRKRIRTDIECDYQVLTPRAAGRWRGEARIDVGHLPASPWRLSACAVWGVGAARRYAMSRPTLGEQPDFHQLAAFGDPLTLPSGCHPTGC